MPTRRHNPAMLDAPGQPVQNNADFILSRMALASCPADVLHDPLRRGFSVYGFLSHLHSLTVTMSQKSSVPQAAKSVP
jgi:hypothetical protein